MADKQSPTERAAPTEEAFVRRVGPEYPEGTHPPAPPDKQTWGPGRFNYSDLEAKLKPDKSTVAQTVEDPMQDEIDDALGRD